MDDEQNLGSDTLRLGPLGRRLFWILILAVFGAQGGLYGMLWHHQSQETSHSAQIAREVAMVRLEMSRGPRVTAPDLIVLVKAMLAREEIDFTDRDLDELRSVLNRLERRIEEWDTP